MNKVEELQGTIEILEEQLEDAKNALNGIIIEEGERRNDGVWIINTSSILTRLIQEAGRWCERFASDLFISWSVIDKKLDNGTMQTEQFVFAMYDNGIHHKAWYECNKDKNYRKVWFLDVETNKDKIKMTLHK